MTIRHTKLRKNIALCNCNYILFTKLPRPGDSEGTFRSLRVKLPPAHLSTTHGGGFTISLLMLNVQQEIALTVGTFMNFNPQYRSSE